MYIQIGLLADETGCIPGTHILFSRRAWDSFFGRLIREVIGEASMERLRLFEQKIIFNRFTMVFGFDPDVGKVAIWALE